MHVVIAVEQGLSLWFMCKAQHMMLSLDLKLSLWQGLGGL